MKNKQYAKDWIIYDDHLMDCGIEDEDSYSIFNIAILVIMFALGFLLATIMFYN
jgi:hypothetical protein